jgi:hypothetical protein
LRSQPLVWSAWASTGVYCRFKTPTDARRLQLGHLSLNFYLNSQDLLDVISVDNRRSPYPNDTQI